MAGPSLPVHVGAGVVAILFVEVVATAVPWRWWSTVVSFTHVVFQGAVIVMEVVITSIKQLLVMKKKKKKLKEYEKKKLTHNDDISWAFFCLVMVATWQSVACWWPSLVVVMMVGCVKIVVSLKQQVLVCG